MAHRKLDSAIATVVEELSKVAFPLASNLKYCLESDFCVIPLNETTRSVREAARVLTEKRTASITTELMLKHDFDRAGQNEYIATAAFCRTIRRVDLEAGTLSNDR